MFLKHTHKLDSSKRTQLKKFCHAVCISILLQCLGCQTPMKCFQCKGVPGLMQGSSLLLCSNVMFLHNKCPNRPPYPPRPLHFSFQHYLILLRCALFCIYIEKCVFSATTFLVQKVSPVTVLALKRSSTVQTSQACTVLWWQPDERGGSLSFRCRTSPAGRERRGARSLSRTVWDFIINASLKNTNIKKTQLYKWHLKWSPVGTHPLGTPVP